MWMHLPKNVSIKPPELIAHRGYALRYPENTLLSLRAAIEAGARYLEFDVQVTADGIPVLLHDADLWRTAGVEKSVLELTLEEVMKLEVNESARFGTRFSGVHVPLLAEVVGLLQEHAQINAFAEIKGASLYHFGVDTVVGNVLAELSPVLSRCVIISFERVAIERAREMGAPAIGWVLEQWNEERREEAEQLRPEFLFCNHRMIPVGAELWPGAWSWALYEVIDPELALALAAHGAQFVETMAIKEMLADRRLIPTARRG